MKGRKNTSRNELLVQVALMKYKLNLTHHDIAKKLGVSTMQISRLLDAARKEKIVSIEVNTGLPTNTQLEEAIKTKYGLTEVIVSMATASMDPLESLIRSAALYIDLIVSPGSVMGIAGGRTITKMIPHLKLPAIKKKNDLQVVQVAGGFLNFTTHNPFSILHEFTNRFEAQGYVLMTPIYVPSEDFKNEKMIKYYHEMASIWKTCTICIGGVGTIGENSVLYLEKTVNDLQMNELVQMGAVGDLFGRWFDESGEYLDCELNRNVVSIPPEIMIQIPKRVMVTGAIDRIPAIKALLNNHVFNICITTEDVARELI